MNTLSWTLRRGTLCSSSVLSLWTWCCSSDYLGLLSSGTHGESSLPSFAFMARDYFSKTSGTFNTQRDTIGGIQESWASLCLTGKPPTFFTLATSVFACYRYWSSTRSDGTIGVTFPCLPCSVNSSLWYLWGLITQSTWFLACFLRTTSGWSPTSIATSSIGTSSANQAWNRIWTKKTWR